ncbi:MAG: methyltransferase domain-containing protein [Planctomycetes bacterium]|nr:methyltransferase domain-containing protein [Planctomycetota bacterium]
MSNLYDRRYNQQKYYWGVRPSPICFEVLKILPPEKPLKLLDIGCGEGRNAIFFARNGYDVTVFDTSEKGLEKTKMLADKTSVKIKVFNANIKEFRLSEKFDILFSTGVLHYIPKELRSEVFENYKNFTNPGGLNVFSVFVHKPFIEKAPDAEATAHKWLSGELLTYYHDWLIKYCTEEIFDCMSSGKPHKHAVSRIIARNN